MDLNYVFLRQQVERSRAASAENAAARSAHEELARAYELRIERKSGGRIVFPWHRGSADYEPDTPRHLIVQGTGAPLSERV
ncbi:MAG TPA: hypothetical protein VNR86_06720 [Sphingomicrobium sp.]|nr:hypothetical protein [Sphingomicrobium sp.]